MSMILEIGISEQLGDHYVHNDSWLSPSNLVRMESETNQLI